MPTNESPAQSVDAVDSKYILTYDEAVNALPEGNSIHTFMNPSGMLLGADWTRKDVLKALSEAEVIAITGDAAQAMKHGIAIDYLGGPLFIQTKDRTDATFSAT